MDRIFSELSDELIIKGVLRVASCVHNFKKAAIVNGYKFQLFIYSLDGYIGRMGK